MAVTDDAVELALAGLLHDIGKFWQRTGEPPPAEFKVFTTDDYGAHGAHAKWSAAFVGQYVPPQLRDRLSAVFYHHKPQEQQSKIVALADRLSSGEREATEEAEPQQVVSIFCRLGEAPPDPQYLPLKPLRLEEDTLRPAPPMAQTELQSAYSRLWDEFAQRASLLAGETSAICYLEGIYQLLQEHAWCVPAAYYRALPDISLFDHSRSTAGIATCLRETANDVLDGLLSPGAKKRWEELPLLLMVAGDLSGLQSFLYTLTSSGAAKGLRGRSFYLQLLTRAAAHHILEDLGLPVTNLLYLGGGRFYLYAPLCARDKLSQVQAEVSRALLRHHRADLFVALGWKELSAADFWTGSRFEERWRDVNEAANAAKRRRFVELPAEEMYESVFAPEGSGGGEEGQCQVCHYEGEDVVELDDTRKCAHCRSFEELGTWLRDAAFVVEGVTMPAVIEELGWQGGLRELGLEVHLADAGGRLLDPRQRTTTPERARLLALRPGLDVGAAASGLRRALQCPVFSGTWLAANVTPRGEDGRIATFSDMAEHARGVPRIGVLRMDLDDLGELFAHGFSGNGRGGGASLATASRVASLSFMLSVFFDGWVGAVCERLGREDDGRERVYTIYSGGDDLFVVGAWDAMTEVAQRLRSDLAWFTARNPSIGLSGGLSLHGGTFPLYQAADEADRALHASKRWVAPSGKEKDAFTFLGRTVGWERFGQVVELRDSLLTLMEEKAVPRSILNLLTRLGQRYEEGKSRARNKLGSRQLYWGAWMWLSAYQLTRMAERHKAAREEILWVRECLGSDDFRGIELAALAARWADLLTRARPRKEGRG